MTPHRHPSVSLTLLYCDPSCCPLTVPTVTDKDKPEELGLSDLDDIGSVDVFY